MAEPTRIPASFGLPPPPKTPEECPAWAGRLTTALRQMYQRLSPHTLATLDKVGDGQFLQRSGTTVVGGTPSASMAVATLTKWEIAGATTTAPAAAASATLPYISQAKWEQD